MKRFLFFSVFIAMAVMMLADNIEKLSAGTQMFLSERKGEITLPKLKQRVPIVANFDSVRFVDENIKTKTRTRNIAEIEIVGSVEMISAFVRVNNGSFSALEGLGAVMQTNFGNNLAAMLLPADKIEAIADLSNVTYIEVAEILEPVNDRQRSVTKAIDAIANSDEAKALGITSPYTGKGVILGVIDTGIDFQHIAFKDKNGDSRIVRAYKLSSSNSTNLTTYSSASQISGLTYDTNAEDHGTHTSTTAGGSSVIVNGSNVTVTDDHDNATYGGMAPEADLVIAGLSSLYTTSIGTAIQNICNYADQQGKPCVISLSLGTQNGPHDGTGTIASIVDQCAGNNHIIVYAASNDGMRAAPFVEMGTSNGGGVYASGTSTNAKPMLANIQRSWSNATGNVQLYAGTIYACARTANVATSLKFHVVNTSTGNVVYSSSAYTSGTTISMTGSTGLAQYFRSQSGYYNPYGDNAAIRITRTQESSGKYSWTIYSPLLQSTSFSAGTSGNQESTYALCVSVYPTNGSTIIDMWEGGQVNWFGNDLELSSSASNSYNLVQGNDECSVSDNACYSKVISVGAYVTKNSITDYSGTVHDYSDEYPNIGDHASFSSWQTQGYGPLGTALPHINAPGARIVAGVNHYHTASVDDYSYYGEDYKTDLVVNSSSYPYAAMEGTSMATPCVSGIIAQWLQACVEAGKTPTPDYIKEVMQNTWDTDQWTNGAGHGAKTFGTHGKINAIKGIQYILGVSGGPVITATPASVEFDPTYVGDSSPTKTFNLKGSSLEGNVTLTLNDPNNVFSLSETTVSKANAESGRDITVTFTPRGTANYTATVTLQSTNADDVVVNLSGTGQIHTPVITANPTSLAFGTVNVGENSEKTFTVTGEYLTAGVTATLSGGNGAFTLSSNSITAAEAASGKTLTVTFTPSGDGNYTGTVTLASAGAQNVTVNLTGAGHVLTPTINVSKDALTFATYINEPVTQTFTVSGVDLDKTVYLALQNDASGVFSLSQASVTANVANGAGREITVTFTPTTLGDYSATVRLTSTGADTKYVTLSGSALEHVPALTTSTQSINFGSVESDEQVAQTFTLNGEYLLGDVTLTLNDANGVFTLSDATVTKADAEAGKTVTVGFSATEETAYSGSITVSTSGLQDITIQLSAEVSNGGTASDAYLNIAKYATIDEAGWNTSYVNNLYKYTEYPSDGVAWLTLPVYGAWSGYRYNVGSTANPQKWITSSVTSNTNISQMFGSTTWNASDIYLGSSVYFTNTTAKYFGNTSTYANSDRTITFYVTNATAVKMLGLNGSNVSSFWSSSSYPTTLNIYECQDNNGTLSEGTTDITGGSLSNATNDASINFEYALDETKIYKVVAKTIRGYLYEIGFQTRMDIPRLELSPVEVDLIAQPNEAETATVTVNGNKLSEDVTLSLVDPNGVYTITPSTLTAAQAMAGAEVTLTLNAPSEGSYRAQLIASSGAVADTIGIYGSVGTPGSAFSRYLNIARYKSIGLNNWYTRYYSEPYKFTKYEDDGYAWLTVPSTMSYIGWLVNDQNWARMTSSADIWSTQTAWAATDVFQGGSYFYGNNTLLMIGSATDDFSNNTEMYYTVYDVTNCSQVKAYMRNYSVYSSSWFSSYDYSPILHIVELTENADGTLTASETVTDQQTSQTNNSTVTLTSVDLDPTKIYRVYVAGYRSYQYEVAFKTPLVTKEGTLAEMVADETLNEGDKYRYTDGNVLAVYLSQDRKTLFCKDDQEYADKVYKTADQTDYLLEMTKSGTINLLRNDYDQSNWVALTLADGSEFNDKTYVGSWLNGVTGTIVDLANPQLSLSAKPSLGTSATRPYLDESNVFIPSNFGASTSQEASGYNFFFMSPKPMEVVNVTWALWNKTDNCFTEIPTMANSEHGGAMMNPYGLSGAFTFDPKFIAEPQLVDGHAYEFVAVVARNNGGTAAPLSHRMIKSENTPSGLYTVYPLSNLNDIGTAGGGTVTGIFSVNVDGREVKEVRYIDVTGRVSKTPWRGVNIVDTIYNDGSHSTKKVRF